MRTPPLMPQNTEEKTKGTDIEFEGRWMAGERPDEDEEAGRRRKEGCGHPETVDAEEQRLSSKELCVQTT